MTAMTNVYIYEDNEGELSAVVGDLAAWQAGRPYQAAYYLDATGDCIVDEMRIMMQDPEHAAQHIRWAGDWVSLEIFGDVDDHVDAIRTNDRLIASVVAGAFAWLLRPQNPKIRRLYDPDWD